MSIKPGTSERHRVFEHAIDKSDACDSGIRHLLEDGFSGEALFFNLALQDRIPAENPLAPIYAQTADVDGFASPEVSPRLAHDAQRGLAQANATLLAVAEHGALGGRLPLDGGGCEATLCAFTQSAIRER